MKSNATTSIWRTTPQLDVRFRELLQVDPKLTYTMIAQRLSMEFGVPLTKNSCIGHGRRTGVPPRQPPRSYAGRKVRTLKLKPYTPKIRLSARFKPKPRPPVERVPLEQLETNDCRWPFGDRPPFLFCGDTTVGLASYCPKHLDIACPAGRQR